MGTSLRKTTQDLYSALEVFSFLERLVSSFKPPFFALCSPYNYGLVHSFLSHLSSPSLVAPFTIGKLYSTSSTFKLDEPVSSWNIYWTTCQNCRKMTLKMLLVYPLNFIICIQNLLLFLYTLVFRSSFSIFLKCLRILSALSILLNHFSP